MSHGTESSKTEVNLDLTDADDQINKVIKQRLNKEVEAIKHDVGNHPSRFLWIERLILLTLLCLSSFIGYQQWQQSQQINRLVRQLTPASQIIPGNK